MYEVGALAFDDALEDIVRPPQWMRDAACAATPDVDFFPSRGESMTSARAVCDACAVRVDCLAYALERCIHEGIWGGTSGRERRRLRAGQGVGDGQSPSLVRGVAAV